MSQLKQDLMAVRELLAVPERWCKGEMACDADGNGVSANNPMAVSFCISGAAEHILPRDFGRWSRIRDSLYALLPDGDAITGFNDADDRTHPEVLALLDKAIEATP